MAPSNVSTTSWTQLLKRVDNHAVLRCAYRSFLRALGETMNEHDIYEALVSLLFLPTATANAANPEERAFYLTPQGRLLFEEIVTRDALDTIQDPDYDHQKSKSRTVDTGTSSPSGGESMPAPDLLRVRRSTRIRQGPSRGAPKSAPTGTNEWPEELEITKDGSASADTSSAPGMCNVASQVLCGLLT